jgi:thioredoxin reductase
MAKNRETDVIIIGGSYAGLSAAMSLGRSSRNVIVIDSGNPCNKYAVTAHNLVGQDGRSPGQITRDMRSDVSRYPTVSFCDDLVTGASRLESGFEVATASGETFLARRLIFATGVTDEMPDLDGFSDCWGKSVLHCPYCHGYEAREKRTAIIATGNTAFELAEMISHWTNNVMIVSNGAANFTEEQLGLLDRNFITVNEETILRLDHDNGYLRQIVFENGFVLPFEAAYARPFMKQQCGLPEVLGCEFHNSINLRVDRFQRTSVEGVFAVGDNCSALRSLANAIAQGSVAGAYINKELIHEKFYNTLKSPAFQ